MINWILGAAIVGFTIYTIMRNVRRMSKGENPCESCSCGTDQCCSKK